MQHADRHDLFIVLRNAAACFVICRSGNRPCKLTEVSCKISSILNINSFINTFYDFSVLHPSEFINLSHATIFSYIITEAEKRH